MYEMDERQTASAAELSNKGLRILHPGKSIMPALVQEINQNNVQNND